MPDWNSLVSSHTLPIKEFAFSGGEELDITLCCRTLGTLNTAKDNAVLLLHGTTGSSLQFLQPSMADALFGKGQPLDCSQYFLIIPDALGHGKSSKPSTMSGASFPEYSYTDIVNAQHRIVRDLFFLEKLRLILGTSMGGMNTWMWGYLYPSTARALMPIACLPEKLAGRNLLFRRLMMAIVDEGGKNLESDAKLSSVHVGLAWNIFQMMVSSPAKLQRELTSPEVADRHILEIIEQGKSNPALDVLWELRASFDYDPARYLTQIVTPILNVNFADDQINAPGYPSSEALFTSLANGRHVIVDAGEKSLGHQTLSDAKVWQSYVSELLTATR